MLNAGHLPIAEGRGGHRYMTWVRCRTPNPACFGLRLLHLFMECTVVLTLTPCCARAEDEAVHQTCTLRPWSLQSAWEDKQQTMSTINVLLREQARARQGLGRGWPAVHRVPVKVTLELEPPKGKMSLSSRKLGQEQARQRENAEH